MLSSLSEKTLQWCREKYVMGDRHIFAEMECVKERVKKETEQSRRVIQ